MDWYALEYVLKRNYTTNREALVNAIKYLYTFWPDTWSDERVKEEFIRVKTVPQWITVVFVNSKVFIRWQLMHTTQHQ